MAHTIGDKKKLITRMRRIRGQVEAIERALESESECIDVVQQIAAVHGAMHGLMAEVIEGHIRSHVIDPEPETASDRSRARQAAHLIEIFRAYMKP